MVISGRGCPEDSGDGSPVNSVWNGDGSLEKIGSKNGCSEVVEEEEEEGEEVRAIWCLDRGEVFVILGEGGWATEGDDVEAVEEENSDDGGGEEEGNAGESSGKNGDELAEDGIGIAEEEQKEGIFEDTDDDDGAGGAWAEGREEPDPHDDDDRAERKLFGVWWRGEMDNFSSKKGNSSWEVLRPIKLARPFWAKSGGGEGVSRATSRVFARLENMAFFSPGGSKLSLDPLGVPHSSSLSKEDIGEVRDVMEDDGEGEGDKNEDKVVALEVNSG